MKMNSKVQVNEVKSKPQTFAMSQRGIRTREAAEHWGVHNGYTIVYFVKAEEKVYGVKSNAQPLMALKVGE